MTASSRSDSANPWAAWIAFATMSAEMMTASAFVIGKRVTRLAAAGALPTARDQREFTLMGQEKLEAAAGAWQAMTQKLFATGPQLALHANRQLVAASAAMTALATSRSPQQALAHQARAANAMGKIVCSGSRLTDAAASIVQAGLEPIHAAATANAERLGKA